jgi:hypothetical protein
MNNTIKSRDNDFEVLPMDEYSGLPSPEAYEDKTVDHDDPERIEFERKRNASLEEYRKQAMELWNDSCTSVRKENV